MFIKESDAKKNENSKSCTVWDYEFLSKDFSFAKALINGRYPEQKRAKNLEFEQVYFVISGFGIIHSEKGDFEINKGDLYFFEKAEVYWVEGSQLLVGLVNVPKWILEQYDIVD